MTHIMIEIRVDSFTSSQHLVGSLLMKNIERKKEEGRNERGKEEGRREKRKKMKRKEERQEGREGGRKIFLLQYFLFPFLFKLCVLDKLNHLWFNKHLIIFLSFGSLSKPLPLPMTLRSYPFYGMFSTPPSEFGSDVSFPGEILPDAPQYVFINH